MPRSLPRGLFRDSLQLKRRWTPDDARAVLGRLESSGLTVREFAEREGLDRQRLYRWRTQFGPTAVPTFVEIARPVRGAAIEVVLRSGHVLRVPAEFETETVRRLVEILADGPARC
jgi:transposase-like protein